MIGHQLGFACRAAGLAPNRLNELRQMWAGDTVFGAHHAVLMRGDEPPHYEQRLVSASDYDNRKRPVLTTVSAR